MNLLDLHEKVNRPLLLDGAMGSVLEMKGYAKTDKLWSARANAEHPEVVKNIHESYVLAGADIITTNTFRTNPAALKKFNYSSKLIVETAVNLARYAIDCNDIILAGCNPPAEDCYQIERTLSEYELRNNHETHLNNLVDAGVDVLWNETFSHLDEIKLVCLYCDSLNIDYTINLFLTHELKLLSGESYLEAIDAISNYNPAAIGFNCFSLNVFNKLTNEIKPDFNFGFYLNCGLSSVNDEQFAKVISPTEYAIDIASYLRSDPIFIGSCCGSNPDHTKKLKELLVEQNTH